MIDFIKEQEVKLKMIINSCGYEPNTVSLIASARPDLGQFQYNGVMGLAKIYQQNPLEIAMKIVNEMQKDQTYRNVNIAGPGFINISFIDEELINFMQQNNDNEIKPSGKTVMIDYGGPNVAKTLHVGHLRSANIGEALKRLAKEKGDKVIADVHLGDWGRPLGLVILELKKRHPEWVYFDENYSGEYPAVCEITNDDLEKIYPIASMKAKEDEAYLEEACQITAALQEKKRGYYALWQQIVNISVADIKKLYSKLNVSFDLWNGESDADKDIKPLLDYLAQKNLTRESEGALILDVALPDDEAPMPPVLLVKSSGAISYAATDLATIWERQRTFNPDEIWYIVDKRQALHFEQIFRAAYKAGIVPSTTKLSFFGFGTMNGEDGKPFKTRDGGVMSLNNLIDLVQAEVTKKMHPGIKEEERDSIAETVAIAALKYADLLPNRVTDYVFDPVKFCDMNGKTGTYLLYSTIRMRSLLRNVSEDESKNISYEVITTDQERDIILMLLNVPLVINNAYLIKSLNDITDYLYDLTNKYNNFYANQRILTESNDSTRKSWIALTKKVYETNLLLLNILGINIPPKM